MSHEVQRRFPACCKMLCSCSPDIRAEEDCGVHMSHSVLCQYCGCTMG